MENTIHVLHLEDDPVDAELIHTMLTEAGLAIRATRVQTRADFETALGDGGIDIMLADQELPAYDGMSALRLARERCPDIPFIFVSGTLGEERAIAALTRGATDYVLKQKLSRLPSAVQRALREAQHWRERKQAERERQANLKHFESMDRINRTLQRADDLEEMMKTALDAVVSIFDCDRAFLMYPCDPDSTVWNVPMESTKPGYPGVFDVGLEMAMDPQVAETLHLLLAADGPVAFGPGTAHELPEEVSQQFGFKSFLAMAVRPRTGSPWKFGIHQCSHARIWTAEETRLLESIGRRLADGLTGLLSLRDLRENERFLRNVVEHIPNMIFVKDAQTLKFVRINKAGEQLLGYSREALLGRTDHDFFPEEEAESFTTADRQVLESAELLDIPEESIRTRSHHQRILHTKKIPILDETGNPQFLLGISEDITEPKQMYEALQDSEERLLLAAKAAQMGLWDWNINTGEIIWSDQCKAHYGFSPETSITCELFLQALHPDDRDRVDAALKRSVEERTSYEVTKRTVWPDESIRWTNSRAEVHCDATGEPVRMVGVTFDITEFKEMEQTLIKREQEFRTLAENSPDNIARYDTNCRTVYVNPALEKTLGRSASEMLGTTPMEVAVINDFREYQEKISEVLQTGKATEMDFVLEGIGKGVRHHNIRFVSERGADDAIAGVLVVGRDVTERKTAEEELRKLSHAIEQSPVSIVITDTAGTIEFVNTRFTEVTGYSYDEALGENPRILKSGVTPAEEYRRLWETISSGEVWRGEFHNRKKDGDFFREQATIAPVRNADNVITHYVAVKEDITERLALESQLRQAQKMDAIGRLAGGIAHDFNNMLAVIIFNAELALERMDPTDPQRSRLDEILNAADRSAEMIGKLLAFGRRQTVSPKVLDLNETVEGILKMLRRLIGENIDLAWLPGARLWPIKVDPSQIDQILANLCVNARDAIEGVGRISIETSTAVFDANRCADRPEATPGEYVGLRVTDDGCGMDEDTLSKLFEPFFSTKEKGKGTGLGLATVYGIVSQNGGFIDVQSEPEHGSTFNIYLPRHAAAIAEPQEETPLAQNARGDESILLVEDELTMLDITTMMLEGLGYRVIAASTPSEAIRLAKEETGEIHLLICDVVLPEMNGRDLAKRLISLRPELSCLFMSGYAREIVAQQGILDEDVSFIPKPFSSRALAAKVRQMLDGD